MPRPEIMLSWESYEARDQAEIRARNWDEDAWRRFIYYFVAPESGLKKPRRSFGSRINDKSGC